MKMLKQLSFLLLVSASIALPSAPSLSKNMDVAVPLYSLVRSLQYVQDSVVSGDFSAMDMQRFLLEQIDFKLREAQPEDFDDSRNVDAALIYAMSGGNPKTLDLVVARDKFGYFDEEVTSVMRAYLNGLVPSSKKPMEELVDEYLNTPIGPYLALVAANVKAAAKDIESVELFNLARLASPGSLIEESSLRRSILISINHGNFDQALKFAHIYARRFSKSPYNVQFSQLVVEMIVQNLDNIDEVIVDEVISYLPVKRKKEIYLRIARTGVIDGNYKMAQKATQKASLFAGQSSAYYLMLSELYTNIINLPVGDTRELNKSLNAIKARSLSPIDRPLHDAAVLLAEQILHLPDEKSLTQAMKRKIEEQENIAAFQSVNLKALAEAPDEEDDKVRLPGDEEFAEYMQGRTTTLGEVDALLEQDKRDGNS